MKLSVIIPAYNEEKSIHEALTRVLAAEPLDKQVIVVNDGSTDRTVDIVESFSPDAVTFINCAANRGKGAAIRAGLSSVSGDMVLIQDADLEYDPDEYTKLIAPIVDGKASVVYGSRILGKNPKCSLAFYFGGRLLTWITNVLYGTRITDEPTCYKVFRTEILKSMTLIYDDFRFCPEVTGKIIRLGHGIHEVPIRYAPRSVSEGKKIGFADGALAIFALIKFRFCSMKHIRR